LQNGFLKLFLDQLLTILFINELNQWRYFAGLFRNE